MRAEASQRPKHTKDDFAAREARLLDDFMLMEGEPLGTELYPATVMPKIRPRCYVEFQPSLRNQGDQIHNSAGMLPEPMSANTDPHTYYRGLHNYPYYFGGSVL